MTRHGMALMLVLVALTVVVTAMTGTMLSLRHGAAASLTAGNDLVLWHGRAAGETLARDWIRRYQSQAVFSPTESQGLTIVADRWHLATGDGGLSVMIYDGLAGIPVCLAATGRPLRRAVPPGAMSAVIPMIDPPRPGEPSDALEAISGISGRMFPRAPTPADAPWEEQDAPDLVSADEVFAGADDAPAEDSVTSEACAVGLSPHSDGRINVNTASPSVLQAAFAVIGRHDLAQILLERRQRRFTTLGPPPIVATGSPSFIVRSTGSPSGPTPTGGLPEPDSGEGIRLVDHSECWSALIQVTWRGRSRSWWVVFDGRSAAVHRVQCHDADR